MESVPDLSTVPGLSLVAVEALEVPYGILQNLCASILNFEGLPHFL